MKNRFRILLLSLILIMLTLPLSVNSVNASPDAKLVIITPHWEGIEKEFEAAFKDYYLENFGEDVDIEWLYMGTSECVKYIDSGFEATPEGIGIDVFWGGGVDPFISAAKKGQLLSYKVDDDVLSKIPSTYGGIEMYDPEYRWYGVALSGFGIIYNKALLELEVLPEPETWEDLTDPILKGWVGSADPRISGSTHMMYEIMLQAYGWEDGLRIATLMGANIKSFPPSSSAIPKSVGAGDIAYGLCIDFYALSQILEHGADKIGFVMPSGLTVINPDSIGILKGSPNLEVAERFVTFVLTEEAQKLWMLPVGAEGGPKEFVLGRMCIIPDLFDELADVAVVPVKNPFEIEPELRYNSTLGSLRWSLVNDLVGATIIDPLDDLSSTWSEINEMEEKLENAGVTSTFIEEAKDKMGESPITLKEALTAVKQWSNATVRNEYISDWHKFAVKKYETASGLVALAEAELTTQEMVAQYEVTLETLRKEKQSTLYTGLGGGAVIGLIIGFAIAYLITRQKEIEAVRA